MNQPIPGGPPPIPPRPPSASGTPPRRRMHGCLIAAIVAACLLVPIAGILLAIALPAYHDYTLRTKVSQAMLETLPLKLQIAEFSYEHQRCPQNGDAGFGDPADYAGATVASIALGDNGDGSCAIELQLQDADEAIDGMLIWFEYDADASAWHCSAELEDRYLPPDCRG